MNKEAMRNELYDYIIDRGIATETELELVSHICGFTYETMEAVVWDRTGMDWGQLLEEWRENN